MRKRKKNSMIAVLCMYPMIIYLAIRLSTFPGGGFMAFMDYAGTELSERPLDIHWSARAPNAILIMSFIYFSIAFLLINNIKNTRHGEEYGSARFASPGYINRVNRTKRKMLTEDMKDMDIDRTYTLYSKNIRVSIVSQCNNINTMVLGAPGTRKSRGFIMPNIMQMNCNMVITDPKAEILTRLGKLLKDNGYDIRVLDLKNHDKSHGYNPFSYFRNENDVFLFVNNMWEAMSDKKAQKGEQIWDDQAKNMLMSIMLYLYYFAPMDEQNFDTVLEIMSVIDSSEDANGDNLPKKHERLFEAIPHDCTAYRYYTMWNSAKGRTLSSIVATLSAKMAVFSLTSMRKLTYHDEINILDLATKKVAVFLILPDSNKVYNFMAGTLYCQMFQQLYDYADNVLKGPLERHVRFFMDEFSNIALPDDYHHIISTSRSRNISFIIVLQDMSQIEALYEKNYRTLVADCAFKLFLGSNEHDTCKYFSELLGKETITIINYNKTYGMRGSTTRNESIQGRDLMTPDELQTKLKNDECIFYSSSMHAVLDKKNDISLHPLYKEIADGKVRSENMYKWGEDTYSVGTVQRISKDYTGRFTPLVEQNENVLWELLDDADIERMISK